MRGPAASYQVMKVPVLTLALLLSIGNGLRAQEDSVRTFSARIVDRANAEPIPFARVQLEGTAQITVTELDGSFTLKLPVGLRGARCYLRVNYIGYEPVRYRVPRSDKSRVRSIRLRQARFHLGEPPVLRMEKQGSPAFIEKEHQ
jgi:hypothetical protein